MQSLRKLHAGSVALAFCLLSADAFAASPGPEGDWLVGNKEARIRIVDCSGAMWGVISWEANPGFDTNNPDAAKRTRRMLGVPIILGMKASGENKWSGEIYNSAWGKDLPGSISLRNEQSLRITGCVLGVLCGGENWTRANDPAPGPSLEQSNDEICKSVAAEQ